MCIGIYTYSTQCPGTSKQMCENMNVYHAYQAVDTWLLSYRQMNPCAQIHVHLYMYRIVPITSAGR